MSQPRKTPQERFDSSVQKTNTCWIWAGKRNQKGYGQLYLGRERKHGSARHVVAHRWAFEMHYGRPVQVGMVLDHTCFNRTCVNPDHLREVTNQFNTFRRKGANPNSTTGFRNVYKKNWGVPGYFVKVTFDGQVHYGGSFATADEASTRAIELRRSLWTEKYGRAA